MASTPSPAESMDDLRRQLAEARREADHDDLTGLLNRRGLRRRLAQLGPAVQAAVVVLDLDGLKRINDSLGHLAGDAALAKAARALGACVREHDLLGRFGGDEFVAVLPADPQVGRSPAAETLVVRFAKAVAQALPADQPVHLSLGLCTGALGDFDRLLGEADAHLRRDKREHRA